MTQQNTFIKLLLPFSIITAVTNNSTTDSLSLNKNLDQVESISVAKKSDNLFEPEYDYTNTSSFRSKSLEESFLTIDKNQSLIVSSLKDDEINQFFTKFKNYIQNENQFYCADFLVSSSKDDNWFIILKSAILSLSEYELSEFISDIFISGIDVFNKQMKDFLYDCVNKYPDTDLSDIASGYLELYSKEYNKL